jgi:phage/plasmid-like protein (TIGR03299 family)
MPALVDSGIYVIDRGLPWHVAGARQVGGLELMDGIERKVKAHEALTLAGADYVCGLKPVYIQAPSASGLEAPVSIVKQVPRKFAVVRLDTDEPLSIVGATYNIFQNSQVADFGEAVLDTGEPDIETAGVLQGGLKVFFSFELPKTIKVEGDDGDIQLYLVVMNGHDGNTPLTAVITPVRVVCYNTLRLAVTRAQSKFVIRHTINMEGRVAQAKTALRIAYEYGDALGRVASDLIQAPVSPVQGLRILDTVFPLPKDATEKQKDTRTALKVQEVWSESPNLANIRHTGWGLVNAITEYQDWAYPYRNGKVATAEERRFLQTLARGESDPASKAAELVLAR